MNNLPFLLCLLLIVTGCMHQPERSSGEAVLKAALDSMYRWDIEKQPQGALMFLDVPYVRQTECDTCEADYLTLSVAKYDSKARPGWIALLLPDNIDREQGVFMLFRKAGMHAEENDSTENSISANLDKDGHETFNARFKGGYFPDQNNRQVDILQKFLDSDVLYLMVFYTNGDHKTISVPLIHFKKQYSDLVLTTRMENPH